MSQHINNKPNNENNSKNKFYQIKTFSEKNVSNVTQSQSNKDVIHTFHLNKLIEQNNFLEIKKFILSEHPSQQVLTIELNTLLKTYKKGNKNFYEIFDLLLQAGVNVNTPVNLSQQTQNKKVDNVSLLMYGIFQNDLDLINIILNYHPFINQKDVNGRTPLIYAIIYNKNDSTDIIKLLIKNKANINYSLNIETNENIYEIHSVFTLACLQNLPRVTKILLENGVDANFRTKPNGDTGLHIAVKYGSPNLLNLLLSYNRIQSEIKNNQGKRAVDLLNENDVEKAMIFKKFYNNLMNNMRINQNQQQGNFDNNNQMIYNNNNNNNVNNNTGNNLNYQQFNQMLQNQMHMQQQQNLNMLNYNNQNSSEHIEQSKQSSNNNINVLDNNSESSADFSDEDEEDRENIINNNKNRNQNEILNNENSLVQENNDKNIDKNNNINLNVVNNQQQNFEIFNNISNDKQKKIKQKLFYKLLNKSNINYNLEIPVSFKKKQPTQKNKNHFDNLSNIIEKGSDAVLNLDIKSKNLELELKINELTNLLHERSQQFSGFETELRMLNLQIEERKKLFKEKSNDLDYLLTLSSQNENKINELELNKKNLLEKIPEDKILQKSNKNIPNKEYLVLKFQPPELSENFITGILQKDLLDYQNYILYHVSQKKPIIENIIEKIQNIINELDPNYIIKIYGSYANGICLPWSDLDLVLVNKNTYRPEDFYINNLNNQNNNETENNSMNILLNNDNISSNLSESNQSTTPSLNNNSPTIDFFYHFYLNLIKQPWVKLNRVRENSSVKIIRITTSEEFGKMNIDISLHSDKHNGLKCVELVKSYIKEYEVLKPLTIALKTILKNANLNNSETGGLTSYGLILMVVSYIQSKRDGNFIEDENNLIGKTFYGFLLHYGIKFDFNKYAIITYKINEINTAMNEKEANLNLSQNAHELMIVDPLNNKNNVARENFQFMNLKMAFMIAFMVTKEDCECGCHYGKAVNENSLCSTEHSYLKRMFNAVKRFTETGK